MPGESRKQLPAHVVVRVLRRFQRARAAKHRPQIPVRDAARARIPAPRRVAVADSARIERRRKESFCFISVFYNFSTRLSIEIAPEESYNELEKTPKGVVDHVLPRENRHSAPSLPESPAGRTSISTTRRNFIAFIPFCARAIRTRSWTYAGTPPRRRPRPTGRRTKKSTTACSCF